MHLLEPKQTKLKPVEVDKLLDDFNISLTQLPKIKEGDLSLPEGCKIGDVIKIDRKGAAIPYYRVVVID